ncbi:hypothetical protein SKAU_G00086080 [Synaphobranchus kaupii]|uniref:Uncharacterized protein n=1 Tax=Synaphobranchus kaupii TaxID=118154 RepID=A0A9Q1J3S6_SYNKA|nr:hypothetical protein SKAU_G00086080 [Synaphobranchus kaupii]
MDLTHSTGVATLAGLRVGPANDLGAGAKLAPEERRPTSGRRCQLAPGTERTAPAAWTSAVFRRQVLRDDL